MFDFSNDSNTAAIVENVDERRQKVLEYIRSLRTIEDAIEPYAEQKRELKSEFKEQGWLTGDEISLGTCYAIRISRSVSSQCMWNRILVSRREDSTADAGRGVRDDGRRNNHAGVQLHPIPGY